MKIGSRKQGAIASVHYRYLAREEKYKRSDIKYISHQNYPSWAKESPIEFWKQADIQERKNGRLYREIEVALPRELTLQQNIELANEYVSKIIGSRHVVTTVVHNPLALDGKPNPHAHIMFSERILDGADRGRDLFFRRPNRKNPEKGGSGKDREWIREEKLKEIRQVWQKEANLALEKAGSSARIDMRSNKAKGLDRPPEPKMGSVSTNLYKKGIVTDKVRDVLQSRIVYKKQEKLESVTREAARKKLLIYSHQKRVEDVEASKILALVKTEKASTYNELDISRKIRYDLGGQQVRGTNEIIFPPTSDSFLADRRNKAQKRYEVLSKKLLSLKNYEQELVSLGEQTLEVKRGSNWTDKDALFDKNEYQSKLLSVQNIKLAQNRQQEQGLSRKLPES